MDNLFLMCASCKSPLAVIKETPKTDKWSDLVIEPIDGSISIIPGSTQICPVCGGYLLLKDETTNCAACGHPVPVPPGGVLTNRGVLRLIMVDIPIVTNPTPQKSQEKTVVKEEQNDDKQNN